MLKREGLCGIMLSGESMEKRRVVGEHVRLGGGGGGEAAPVWSLKGMAYVVGNGRRVKFWVDRWCRGEP